MVRPNCSFRSLLFEKSLLHYRTGTSRRLAVARRDTQLEAGLPSKSRFDI